MSKLSDLWRSGRLPAFLVHVGISLTLVLTLAAATWLFWYPPPYFRFDGGWQVLRLVAVVDVVLGPLLTLVVYRRGKKGLAIDLSIIGGVQLAAFIYGAAVLVQYRPAFLVYAPKNFYAVPWPEVERYTRDQARIQAMRTGGGPVTVVLDLPADTLQQEIVRQAAKASGARVTLLGDYYQTMTPAHWAKILPDSVNLAAQLKDQPELAADLEDFSRRFLQGAPVQLERYAFYPGVFRYGVILFVLDRADGHIVGWLTD